MLVNLIPEFLSTLSAADRSAAYHEYLDRHRPILGAYWQNYVLDPESPHAEPIIENALRSPSHPGSRPGIIAPRLSWQVRAEQVD